MYEEPDKPSDALSFVRNIFAASEMQTMRAQVENLTKENEQLKTKVSTLETDKADLEKKIVKMEEVAAAAAKDSEKKDESPASPKQVDEGDVSNETPQVNSKNAKCLVFDDLKFIYSEKAIKFCRILTLLLSYVMPVKSKLKISQNFVAFSEFMNFKCQKILGHKFKKINNKVQLFFEGHKNFRNLPYGFEFGQRH